ncbi:MAG: tetratricopeptide repeat protein [Pseudomonadota bacterium]
MRLLVCSIFIILIICGKAWATSSPITESEVSDLYGKGSAYFREANDLVASKPGRAKELYGKAVLYFERIIREGGIENGKLFYNIGNAYFRMGDLGRAILNYRKAERYIPNNINLVHNLNYAKNRRVDQVKDKIKTRVYKTIFFWHYDLSLKTRFMLFLFFFDLVWVWAITALFFKKAWIRYGIIISALFVLLFAGSTGIEVLKESRTHTGVILAKEVFARKGDSVTYEPSFTEPLHAGTDFKLVESRMAWLYIELTDGRQCWIPEMAAGLI